MLPGGPVATGGLLGQEDLEDGGDVPALVAGPGEDGRPGLTEVAQPQSVEQAPDVGRRSGAGSTGCSRGGSSRQRANSSLVAAPDSRDRVSYAS